MFNDTNTETPVTYTAPGPEVQAPAADTPEAPQAVEAPVDPSPAEPKPLRRPLEEDLKTVLDNIVTGKMTVPEGKSATPHVISGLIKELRGGDAGDRPSSGAVAAALNRWAHIGYITLNQGPTSFADYTNAGRQDGLAALKKANRDRLAAARAARKAASTPAPAPASTTDFAGVEVKQVNPDPSPAAEPIPVPADPF